MLAVTALYRPAVILPLVISHTPHCLHVHHFAHCMYASDMSADVEIQEHIRRQQQRSQEKELQKQRRFEQAEKDGSLVECGCCFMEYLAEDIIICKQGHQFCENCVRQTAHHVSTTTRARLLKVL